MLQFGLRFRNSIQLFQSQAKYWMLLLKIERAGIQNPKRHLWYTISRIENIVSENQNRNDGDLPHHNKSISYAAYILKMFGTPNI